MVTTNKSIGNDFESRFCEMLFENGFWVHRMTQNNDGQPADVIAARKGKSYLIDCKKCTFKRFALSRIEENQHLTMELWKQCGNGEGWFAIEIKDEIIMISHANVVALSNIKFSVTAENLKENGGVSLEKWLKKK